MLATSLPVCSDCGNLNLAAGFGEIAMDLRSFVFGVVVAYTLPFLALLWMWRRELWVDNPLFHPPPNKIDS